MLDARVAGFCLTITKLLLVGAEDSVYKTQRCWCDCNGNLTSPRSTVARTNAQVVTGILT